MIRSRRGGGRRGEGWGGGKGGKRGGERGGRWYMQGKWREGIAKGEKCMSPNMS